MSAEPRVLLEFDWYEGPHRLLSNGEVERQSGLDGWKGIPPEELFTGHEIRAIAWSVYQAASAQAHEGAPRDAMRAREVRE